MVSDSIIVGFSKAASFVANNAASILNVVSYLPGIDYSDTVASLRQFAVEANGVATEAMNNIDETLSRPLAGEAFKQFYKDAQAAAEEAAKSVVKLRNETKNTGDASTGASSKLQKSARDTRDAVAEQISALERAAKIWGMSADEVQIYDLRLKGANETQLAYAKSLLDTVAGLEKQKKLQEEASETALYVDALRNQLDVSKELIDIEVMSIGMGRRRAEQLKQINEIQRDYARRIEELARAQGTANALSEEQYQARVKALRDAMEQEVAIVEEGERRKEEARQNGINGAKRALEDYIESAKDLASQFEQTATSVLNGLEDSLTTFVLTGKLSFKDLANSIIADLARIAARQLTANLAQGLLGAAGGVGGGTGLAASFAGLFDNGGKIRQGEWGIVGEKGPEIITGPATVTGRRETAEKIDQAIARAQSNFAEYNSDNRSVNNSITILPPSGNDRAARESQASMARQVAKIVSNSARYT